MPSLICDFCSSDQRFAIRLPSDSTSRWTPLPLAVSFPLSGHFTDFHRIDYARAGRTAKANGGSGTYTYGVYYKKTTSEKWSTAQSYSANNTVTIKPAAAVKYDVCVKVKDSTGRIVKQYFTVSVTKELTNISTLSATTVKKGGTVTATAKASGGTGKYTYGVYYKKTTSDKWSTVQSYSANKTVTIKPAAAVKYDICIKVKDSSGKIVKKYFVITCTK